MARGSAGLSCFASGFLGGSCWRSWLDNRDALLLRRLAPPPLAGDAPNFSTLSRRQKTLAVNIPHRGLQGPLHRLIGSTGIKVAGEGEGNARKHGGPRCRVRRMVHLGFDEETLGVRAADVTCSDVGDAPMLPELLSQIPC